MLTMLLQWVLVSLLLMLIANLLPGITIASFSVALIAMVMFGLINVLVKPILLLLTLPLNLVTLGLFTFVVNALMFALGAYLVPGFQVENLLSAFIGSVLLSLASALVTDMLNASPA